MSRILVTGANSQICKELKPLLPIDCEWVELNRKECDMRRLDDISKYQDKIQSCDRIVIAHGTLLSKTILDCTHDEITDAISVNLLSTVKIAEMALTSNPNVRIVVMGSESGVKGSFDTTYWLSKAALDSYVRERHIASPQQQLVCLAPSMVMNTGMTSQKSPQLIEKTIQSHPKKRGIDPKEVANWIHFLLFVEQGYVSNTTIEMNGGKFARQVYSR